MKRFLIALAAVLALPATATGHSLVRPGGAVVSYLSQDATSLNQLVVRPDGNRIELLDRAVDGGMDPGPCTPGELNPEGYIIQAFCPAGPVQRIRVDLGDREDTATVAVAVATTVLAGAGADRASTGAGADELDGGTGNDVLAGGPGDDVLVGGAGADELDGGDGADRLLSSDGEADRVTCGAGADTVEADALDAVDASCETVARTGADPVARNPDVPGPPRLAVGAHVLQRLGVVRIYATSSEPATLGASGSLAAGGRQLPITRLPAREVPVGGGGAVLEYRLAGRLRRAAARALREGRRARIALSVVATDQGGASSRRAVPRITLRPATANRSFRDARHPEPGDRDGDEVKDEVDNCPDTRNGSQLDTDKDGAGDACDPDDDEDGVPDERDNCDLDVNPGQEDADGDGHGDACPPVDTDGDKHIDDADNCDTVVNPDQADLDGDDFGDACDRDDDGDGFDDQYDNCPTVYNLEPTDTNGDGFKNDQADGDGDGVGTACDPDESTVAPPPPPQATPTPAPVPLEASAVTGRRQRLRVIGAGPIVTVRCNAACDVRSVLSVGPRTLAAGEARLAGAGGTYAFLRIKRLPRKAVRGVLTTTVSDADGIETILRRPIRLRP